MGSVETGKMASGSGKQTLLALVIHGSFELAKRHGDEVLCSLDSERLAMAGWGVQERAAFKQKYGRSAMRGVATDSCDNTNWWAGKRAGV